ncbi:hypothetical protein BU16DRAFT_514136 [Lophium mytilinum]|uniref:DUF7580 domain-containing protein n=1 Tax=Lophium mytilinum TaxID=390894 RepID=A0A6A6QKA4_9PEZI|nr:hypothetical protein BU16DRAFT_514136 [Lophium mytilinum]
MVTGVECAGLVLALLPLFIEAGKAYSDGVDTVLNVSLKSRRNASLSDFYDEFYWEISELGEHVAEISRAISDSPGQYRPASALKLDDWIQNSEVEKRLRRYFGSEAAFNKFSTTSKRIVQLLAQLLKNQMTYVANKDLEESEMYEKLKGFALERETKRTKSNFMERFHFFRKKNHRNDCLQRLKLRNQRLRDLIEKVGSQTHGKSGFFLALTSPSAPARLLTRKLYDAFARSWKCTCNGGHEARFCIYVQEASANLNADVVDLDFFITTTSSQNSAHCWQEGTVSVCSASIPRADDETRLQRVCDALKMGLRDFRLRILMEDINGQQSLWRLAPKPRRIHNLLEPQKPISLGELLVENAKMGPLEKRRLALICSYSLLLFHDSPWLSRGWNKSNLSFFVNLQNEPDYTRPYLSTRFESPARQVGQPNSGVFHPNSNILTLGILLIEIHNEKPIECWRSTQERSNLTAATEDNLNLIVADRIVKKMDASPYRSSVEACLDLTWVQGGQSVRLDDAETRNGIYANVIEPLEREVEWLT